MRRRLILPCLIIAPLLIIILVNELSPAPTHAFSKAQCTRACHDSHCVHFSKKIKTNSTLFDLLESNINWLKNNPFGLSYQHMNLLLYICIIPLSIMSLVWGLIRKDHA